jgi:uncharacterized membrane protein YhaH (DUF805 family)
MNWGHILFSFGGRINRAKWWLALLVTIILSVIVEIITGFVDSPGVIAILFLVVSLLSFWIGLASGAKRLHDRDKSAAWLWLFYGFPILMSLVFFAIAGAALYKILVPGQLEQSEAAIMEAITTYGAPIAIIGLAALVIGIWALIWLGCLRGTMGPNRFGPDPLGGYGHPYGDPPQQPYPQQGQGQPPQPQPGGQPFLPPQPPAGDRR